MAASGTVASSGRRDGPNITLDFQHAERETMVRPLRINRESVVGVAFEAEAGPAGWRTAARLVVRTSDGATVTVSEDDSTERLARTQAPSTMQGNRPEQFTREGAFAR
jgi:hypothetical protein